MADPDDDFDCTADLRMEDEILQHIILPRELPQKTSEKLQDIEADIIKQMIKIAEKWKEKLMPMQTFKLLNSLYQFHEECTSQNVCAAIDELCPGDEIAMFIRPQNCAIMIHVPSNEKSKQIENVIIAAFPGQLNCREIYRRHDRDIEFHYPETAIKVKYSKMLRSHEFSNLLCVLNERLPPAYRRQDCVKWLITLLMDGNSKPSTQAEFPIVIKKVRDEIWGNNENYFRRSTFYMSVKAMIQTSLWLHMDTDGGRLRYKLFMLKLLNDACNVYKGIQGRFNIDLLSQAIAKLARRIEKLSNMEIADDLMHLYEETIGEAKDTIETIRKMIDAQIKRVQSIYDRKAYLLTLSELNFKLDIRYKDTELERYVQEQERNTKQNDHKSVSYDSYKRYFTTGLPAVDSIYEVTHEIDCRIFWIDFERIILYQMNIEDHQLEAKAIRSWSCEYTKFAEKIYKNNQLFISRMVLVRLKLLAMLDSMAIDKCPLLRQHNSGVNHQIIDCLLLPQCDDMRIAFELEEYFRKRNKYSKFPSLIVGNDENCSNRRKISKNAFSVRYASEDLHMQLIRDQILAKDNKKKEGKTREWKKGREKVDELESQAKNMDHDRISKRNFLEACSKDCRKCALERNVKDICYIQPYETLLPKDDVHQFAVVFELKMPDVIACLRDILYLFANYCHGDAKKLQIKKDWCDQLKSYKESINEYVHLGSTTKKTLKVIHVNAKITELIVVNSSNFVYHSRTNPMPSTITTNQIKNLCTFKPQYEYVDLKWAMYGTDHTENKVLSQQSECGSELTLSEFKNFGTLRADGHRLQIRKLYAMLETEALSFEKEDVLTLVMQTLWECESSGKNGFIREAHIDFCDAKFCETMIKLLKKLVEQQEKNWKYPFKLLAMTLIAVRAFEINENDALANQILTLLIRIRCIALDWIGTIEERIHGMINPDECTERNLRLKLIYVAIIGTLTFFIHPNHKQYANIFRNKSSTTVESWLRCVISLKNNIRMYTSNEEKLPTNLRMFLRLVEYVGVSIEAKVKEVIRFDSEFMKQLVAKQWSSAESMKPINIYFNPRFPQIFVMNAHIDSTIHTVSIDVIIGLFLVNDLPLSRLPSEIMNNDIYRWFFDDVVFEVQPDAAHKFSTVQKYNGCSYEFKMIGNVDEINSNDNSNTTNTSNSKNRTKNIKIIEKKFNGHEKELIDHYVLKNDFSHHLVHNYSHWWNKDEKCIEFRKRTFGKKHFSKETTVDYRFNLINCHLIHVKTQCQMLNIMSESYDKIIEQLTRLENKKYINVLYIDEDETVTNENVVHIEVAYVELLRMNLKFAVIKESPQLNKYYLISKEFNGMRVIQKQNIGTLFGLKHGLTLADKDNKKIILIPNGLVQIENENGFADVSIDTKGKLSNPSFYQYQVDTFCGQLKSINGSHASWLFLAYLHAITTLGQIEPFIKMTGTERAIQILQSAIVWSSTPYDSEAIKILRDISNLTPVRECKEVDSLTKKKKKMIVQSVTWPENIPTHAAQDCFIFIVKKLLEDSRRLWYLYGKNSENKLNHKTDMELNERDHRRCQRLNPNLNVSNAFIEHKIMKTERPSRKPFTFSDDTRTVCVLYHMKNFKLPTNFDLKQFLTGDTSSEMSLIGLENCNRIPDLLNHSTKHDDFRNLWISLYDTVAKQKLNSEQIIAILSYFAHRKENISPILALQTVATNPNAFQHINPPAKNSFPMDGTINAERISDLLMKFYKSPDKFSEWSIVQQRTHKMKLTTIQDDITAEINNKWPCNSYNFTRRWSFEYIDFEKANAAVNDQLSRWYVNYELNNFIEKVERQFLSLIGFGSIRIEPCLAPTSLSKEWSRFSIDMEAKICQNMQQSRFEHDIEDAKSIWQMNSTEHRSAQNWWKILERIYQSDETLHLVHAGLFPRLAPSLVLTKLTDSNVDQNLKCLIGSWAIAITHEQCQNRIAANSRCDRVAMEREIENKPHTNWRPNKYPEWLLFEIEQNLTIRRIQIEIAKRMIEPPERDSNRKHSVMQLNMGEGKTAVIVPILAARLANGHQACQIIVLKSLFATNLKSLRQYLGGMLNRRVYVFPCRRDMPIESHAIDILEIYKECQQKKGVILTLPEYRLSYQLKIYESIANQLKIGEIHKRNFKIAENFLNLFKWTNANVRSILDESDAILQPKYQLIYTVGNQMKPDGDSHRWLVAQALLKRIPMHMQRLYKKYGKEKIEFGYDGDDKVRTDIFTPCRILDESIYEELKMALIDDFITGRCDIDFPGIDESRSESVKELLSKKAIDRGTFLMIKVFSEERQNIILILSGLLRFEVLKLALTKRWRVSYGVDVKGRRKMAVPFKAKDVSADGTEFGHPDVAVSLTQMSYYYSGLSDAQLYQVFDILENSPDKSNIYGKWIEKIPHHQIVPSIVSYSGVNLDDPDQRDGVLFPLLRQNMNVIDFWLSNIVYPQELKVFEKKLMCTAWDLCSDHVEQRVTGFSGTNDTKNILPLTVAQNDLAELENTNEEMRMILLDPRNMVYQNPCKMGEKEILRELVKHEVSVLLDSGALMLELSNKEVAIEWLNAMPSNCNAAIYFDETDTLQTIDRNGFIIEFDYSVYRENLNNCVVYLDDVHTRGTDLKFPADWVACVTLSGDITRDKTVQACMRMRQLKTTQSILFLASHEADICLRKLSGQRRVESRHVMEFIEKNTKQFETANMAHWTADALNYTKKLIGHKMYEKYLEQRNMENSMVITKDDKVPLERLYENCVDDDFIVLKKMFGEKEEALLYDITHNKFSILERDYRERDYRSIRNVIQKMKNDVCDKLDELAPDVKRFATAIDDEQEKELEQEIEEQTQRERPRSAQPAKPHFDLRLKQLVRDGVDIDGTFDDMKADGSLLPIVASLSNTQMFTFCENNGDAFASHLLVTKDFVTVIEHQARACNDFLRPVCWIARIKNPNANELLIVMSSYECNKLLPSFRKSINATLYMYRPRLSNLHSNLIHDQGLHVTGMTTTDLISIEDEVQIGVYAGMLYFDDEDEENAYCNFLGLIPRPKTGYTFEQKEAFESGYIEENGYVRNREHNCTEAISQCISQCKFKKNPTDLAVKLIKAHHQVLPKDSHVASILIRGIKSLGTDDDMDID